jgi:RNA polymerase sigma-70 factor (ECF subfamily)
VKLDKFAHISDTELIDKFYIDNDSEWIGILLQRYTLLLLGTCMKYLKDEEEAKDSVQQIFIKAITEIQKKYKIDYFKSWLYIIARNYCLMKLRNKRDYIPIEEKTQVIAEENKLEITEKEKRLSLIEASIVELNEEQKTCVTLFYLERKSYTEIATITNNSLLQVKSNIQNGKRNLKILVEKKIKKMNGE